MEFCYTFVHLLTMVDLFFPTRLPWDGLLSTAARKVRLHPSGYWGRVFFGFTQNMFTVVDLTTAL